MLNRAIGGAYGFTTDIGGYFDVGPYRADDARSCSCAGPSGRRCRRSSASTARSAPGTHTPWSYDARDRARSTTRSSRLHLRARPLILRLWREARADRHPADAAAVARRTRRPRAPRAQDQEWLLGADVLVAPVVTRGRDVAQRLLPARLLAPPGDGRALRRPARATVAAALDQLPYFFRCGTAPFAAADGSGGARCRGAARAAGASRSACASRAGASAARARLRQRPRVRTLRGRRLRARVDLRGLPRRRVRIRVVARTDRGRTLREARTYRTCTRR